MKHQDYYLLVLNLGTIYFRVEFISAFKERSMASAVKRRRLNMIVLGRNEVVAQC